MAQCSESDELFFLFHLMFLLLIAEMQMNKKTTKKKLYCNLQNGKEMT